jgi:DNA polymerase III alpha subunit
VEEDGTIRMGLRYVSGLRAEVGKAIAARRRKSETGSRESETHSNDSRVVCPKCGCDDGSMIEIESRGAGLSVEVLAKTEVGSGESEKRLFCNVCSSAWTVPLTPRRFRSIDELVRVTGLRRDEVTVLAEIGALNSFGFDRRSAVWQAERAVRPAGELYESMPEDWRSASDSGASQGEGGESPIGESPIGESPIDKSPIEKSSIEKSSIEKSSIEKSPIINESPITNRQSPINHQSSISNHQFSTLSFP